MCALACPAGSTRARCPGRSPFAARKLRGLARHYEFHVSKVSEATIVADAQVCSVQTRCDSHAHSGGHGILQARPRGARTRCAARFHQLALSNAKSLDHSHNVAWFPFGNPLPGDAVDGTAS